MKSSYGIVCLDSDGLQKFFEAFVVEALEDLRVHVAPAVRLYLTSLLAGLGDQSRARGNETLEVLRILRSAQDDDPPLSLSDLKAVGDRTLLRVGLFPRSIIRDRRVATTSLRMRLGSTAYQLVAEACRDQVQRELFAELGGSFGSLVYVLQRVGVALSAQDGSNLPQILAGAGAGDLLCKRVVDAALASFGKE